MDHLRHQKYKNKRLQNNFKLINISINYMDKFEKKELTKKRTFTKILIILTMLINYILELIKKIVGGVNQDMGMISSTIVHHDLNFQSIELCNICWV